MPSSAALRFPHMTCAVTYAKLALKNGAKIDQIQLNLGHESLATTQVYLGTELDLKNGPGDFLPIQIA